MVSLWNSTSISTLEREGGQKAPEGTLHALLTPSLDFQLYDTLFCDFITLDHSEAPLPIASRNRVTASELTLIPSYYDAFRISEIEEAIAMTHAGILDAEKTSGVSTTFEGMLNSGGKLINYASVCGRWGKLPTLVFSTPSTLPIDFSSEENLLDHNNPLPHHNIPYDICLNLHSLSCDNAPYFPFFPLGSPSTVPTTFISEQLIAQSTFINSF